MSNEMPEVHAYVAGISSDVIKFIACLGHDKLGAELVENDQLDQRSLLMLRSDVINILILHWIPDLAFVYYCQELFDNYQVEVWGTSRNTGETAEDVLNDTELFARLLALGQMGPLHLSSYTTSQGFLDLVAALKAKGISVKTPEHPDDEHADTVDAFGTKSGIRRLVNSLKVEQPLIHLQMAPGEIFTDPQEAAIYAADIYLKKNGVVIKTDKGHAGMGVVLVKPNQLPKDFETCVDHFNTLFAAEPYWSQFPIVVEELLDIDTSIGGGNPNCEFRIGANGEIEYLFTCGMRVSAEGVFQGIEIGKGILPRQTEWDLLQDGYILAAAYAKAGYRGYFDVDEVATKPEINKAGVITKPGELFLAESNVRQTGGTHVYLTAEKLLGADFADNYYVASNNLYPIPNRRTFLFSEIQEILRPLLFSKETKEGVVLAGDAVLTQGKLSYMVIGKDKERAYQIEAEMKALLEAA